MAIVARTWIAGELVTSAKMNSLPTDLNDLDGRLSDLGVIRGVTALPAVQTANDVIAYFGNTLREFGAWGPGIDLQAGAGDPSGVAIKDNGDMVVVTTADKMFIRVGGAWGAAIDTPEPGTYPSPVGVDVNPAGDIVVLIYDATGQGAAWVSVYSGGVFAAHVTLGWLGNYGRALSLAIKPNGDYVIGTATGYIVRSGGVNSALNVIPTGADAAGIGITSNGDIVIADKQTDKVYTEKAGVWDTGVAAPTGEGNLRGLDVKADGTLVVVGSDQDQVFTSTLLNPTYPTRKGLSYWTGARWDNL